GDLDPLTAGLVAFTVATLGFYLLSLLAQPLVGWDAIAMWLFKAKVFFDSGSVDLANLPPRPISATRHLDYPPLFSLMVATAWVLLSHVDDMVGKSIGFMFLISGVAAVFVFGAAWGRVKERETPSLLLVSVAAAGLLPVVAWQVYTRVHGFNSDVLSLPHPAWTIGLLTSRARTIASFFFHLMNRNDDYPWLAAGWIVATVLTVISRYRRLTLVWAALTAQGLTYGIALLTTPNEVTFELN